MNEMEIERKSRRIELLEIVKDEKRFRQYERQLGFFKLKYMLYIPAAFFAGLLLGYLI